MERLISPGGGGPPPQGGPGGGGGFPSQQQQKSQQEQEEEMREQQQRQEDFRNQVLNQVLDQQARARLATLSLAKPEKAQQVEMMLIQMARMGRFGPGAKVNEEQLKDILEKVGGAGGGPMGGGGGGMTKSSSVTFTRRNLDDDEDEDEYNRIMEDL